MSSDPYHFETECSHHKPALGHAFESDLACKCGQTWAQQQRAPTVCEGLMERLEGLHTLESELRFRTVTINVLKGEIQDLELVIAMVRERGISIPSREEARSWWMKKKAQKKRDQPGPEK